MRLGLCISIFAIAGLACAASDATGLGLALLVSLSLLWASRVAWAGGSTGATDTGTTTGSTTTETEWTSTTGGTTDGTGTSTGGASGESTVGDTETTTGTGGTETSGSSGTDTGSGETSSGTWWDTAETSACLSICLTTTACLDCACSADDADASALLGLPLLMAGVRRPRRDEVIARLGSHGRLPPDVVARLEARRRSGRSS